jgi:hypothetical protein
VNLAEAIEAGAPVRRFKPYPAYKDSSVEWLGRSRRIGTLPGFPS